MISPLFYIGVNRCGTTWLGNILIRQFDIPGAYHKLHYGAKENYMCANSRFWGPFDSLDRYLAFLSIYAETDFFRMLHLDKTDYMNKKYRNFYHFFFELMDHYAEGRGHKTWVTKFDLDLFLHREELRLFAAELDARYERVRFINIGRAFRPYITSYASMIGRGAQRRTAPAGVPFVLIMGLLYYHFFNDCILKFLQNKEAIRIEFETLTKNHSSVMERISTFLSYPVSTVQDLPARNSSVEYSNRPYIPQLVLWGDRLMCRIPVLARILIWLRRRLKSEARRLPNHWRILKSEYFESELREELESERQFALVEVLEIEGND